MPLADNPPPARADHNVVTDSDQQYLYACFGRDKDFNRLNDLWRYDPSSNAWTNLNPANSPEARYGSAGVWINGKYIVFGGRGADATNYLRDTQQYNPATNAWQNLNPMGDKPNRLAFHSMAVAAGLALLFGGEAKYMSGGTLYSKISNELYSYNSNTNEWTYICTPGPPARKGALMWGYNYKLYLFGGIDKDGNALKDFWEFDSNTHKWTRLPDPPVPARGYAAGAQDGDTYRVMGGETGNGSKLDGNYKYNHVTQTWTQQTSMPQKRTRSGAGVVESGGETKTDVFAGYADTPVTPGEGCDSGCNRGGNKKSMPAGDPIYTGNGAYRFTLPLLNPGGLMGLQFGLIYGSDLDNVTGNAFFPDHETRESGYFRFWWSPECAGDFSGDPYQFWLDDFRTVAFDPNTGEIDQGKEAQPVVYQMEDMTDHIYLMDPIRELVYIFEKASGKILYIMDRNSNNLSYTYAGGSLTRIADGLGRTMDFTYTDFSGDQVLTGVTGQGGRAVSLNYEENAADNNNTLTLRSVTDSSGKTATFSYSPEDYVTGLELPEGNTPYTQSYGASTMDGTQATRVTQQTDADNNRLEFSYASDENRVTTDWPDGSSMVHKSYGPHNLPKDMTDAAGKTMDFGKDARDRMTSVTDRMGDTTTIAYHSETGKVRSVTNNKGNTITYHYTVQSQTFTNPDNAETVDFTFYNLTKVDYPDGTNTQFTFDARGNILTRIDRAGKTRTYAYNDKGQVTQITNPAGGKTTFTYNADATPASSTGSDTGVTTYEYDAYKRVKKIIHPDGTSVQMAYDLNNRMTSVTDELGKTYAYAYDANGSLTSATDPDNKASQYAHDLMDRVNEITNRRGKKSQLAYDNMSRLQSFTDPNGNKTQYAYNSRGWLNQITDPGNKLWTTAYDDEGLMSSMTTPLNRTTNIGRDKLGFVTSITDPMGNNATLTRDSLSRITQTTDPLNRQTSYGYDNRGLLTSVTLPVVGAAQYTRNNLGLLSNITDLNNQAWGFEYTDMGRISSLTDPLNQQLQYAYDPRGRLNQITYPDAATQTRTLSASGNMTAKSWSDGPDLQFTYDDLDRLTTGDNITLTYNEVGQVTATANPPASFGATYDNGGRVETITYADGLFTVTYTHDARSLLSKVTDDLTNTTIQFTHDDDGRLTGITRSNNKNTTFTLDAASRVAKIQHGALGEMTYTYNEAGEVTKLDYTLPLDPADFLTGGTENFTVDAASQVSTTGYGYDTRGRLTTLPGNALSWDGAARLTSTSDAAMTYNGLGDLSTRVESGQTTRYYYNYALGLHPMVAEMDETGNQWKRFYVLSPGGTLLYMIDAADGNKVYCYHFDKMGNTLFLTDAAGTITDKYAYTPYGKLLAHEGSNGQPFTFVGAWQIRQEGNGIYQMRARYYDAATARFVSREPLWPRIGKPGSLNPYQYAAENPVKFVDVTGLDSADFPENDLHKWSIDNHGWKEVAPADVQDALEQIQENEDWLRRLKKLGGPKKKIKIAKKNIKNLRGWIKRQKAEQKAKRGSEFTVVGISGSIISSSVGGAVSPISEQGGGDGIMRGDAPDNDMHEYTDDNDGWKDVDEPPKENIIGKGKAVTKVPALSEATKKVPALSNTADCDTPIAHKLYLLKFKSNEARDIPLSIDWEGSPGSLNVQPFNLAR